MGIKIESVEERQLPRWVYAMMNANRDPNDPDDVIADNPQLRFQAKVKAENFYKQRQERLKELDQQNLIVSSRITGMEWAQRPKTKFTSEELDKIMPTRRPMYIIGKTAFISLVSAGVIAATFGTFCIGAAICAEIKLSGSFGQAWAIFSQSPSAYVQRVENALQ